MNIKIEYLCDKPLLTLCETKKNIELPINWYHWGSYIFVEHNDIEYALLNDCVDLVNPPSKKKSKKTPNFSVSLASKGQVSRELIFKCNHCNSLIEFERIRCGHLFGMDYINCGSCAKSFCIKNIEKNDEYYKKCFSECLKYDSSSEESSSKEQSLKDNKKIEYLKKLKHNYKGFKNI